MQGCLLTFPDVSNDVTCQCQVVSIPIIQLHVSVLTPQVLSEQEQHALAATPAHPAGLYGRCHPQSVQLKLSISSTLRVLHMLDFFLLDSIHILSHKFFCIVVFFILICDILQFFLTIHEVHEIKSGVSYFNIFYMLVKSWTFYPPYLENQGDNSCNTILPCILVNSNGKAHFHI